LPQTSSPEPLSLVAEIDPAFGKQVFNVSQRQRVFDVHHDDQPDHFRRAVELAERALHPGSLSWQADAAQIAQTEPGQRPILADPAVFGV
jgi:hypothetical protein